MERKKSVIEGFSDVISARRATEVPTGSVEERQHEQHERGDHDLAAVARQAAAAQRAGEQRRARDHAEHPERHRDGRAESSRTVTSVPSSSRQRSHEKLVSSPLITAAALVTPW